MMLIINILFLLVIGAGNRADSGLSDYLNYKLRDYKRFKYEVVSPKNIDLSKIEFDTSREIKINRNYGYVPIVTNLPKGKSKNNVLTIKLKLYKDVLVASRKISKKEVLNQADFRIIEKEVSLLRHEPIAEPKYLNNYRAKFNIAPKTILQSSMVEKIPDIQLGDRVDAVYNKGIVNVSFPVIARSEGIVGDIIKVRRDDRKIFKARILNNNKVKIVE